MLIALKCNMTVNLNFCLVLTLLNDTESDIAASPGTKKRGGPFIMWDMTVHSVVVLCLIPQSNCRA
ncbi:hypothetical protein L798_15701 [Zootermopsis nevadensis]|uniref:Uncharacterized protein n=1 Tax=Zootermopsis nevadensis TaxID=136037 RepID=A0A067QNQ9_ZOONE|nr:hypothetical protein L798_15701 [Zootermopsis nevadensis]